MKTLIAVVTSRSREAWREAIRSTWLPQVHNGWADVFFFMGRGEPREFKVDEVSLDCEDAYMGLPEKVREIARWSYAHDYGHTLKCDDDVVLMPSKILTSGYQQWDYSGKSNRGKTPAEIPFGFNYWFSKKCAGIIGKAELPSDKNDNDDEKWVANTLYANGIYLHDDQRYCLHQAPIYESPMLVRPLRAPKRNHPKVINEYLSWCIHIPAVEHEARIEEFKKVFSKYGES